MSTYRVSILVSFYNSSKFIVHKMQNLSTQTIFDECEVLFIDGGGDRSEVRKVKRFVRDHDNCKLLENNDQRITLYKAWNRGLMASKAPYVCNSNTDDVLAPNAIQKLVEALEDDPDAGVAFPNIFTTTKPNMKWGTVSGGYINTSAKAVIGPFAMWRRDLHFDHGIFDDRLYVFGDADWWNRLRKAKIKFVKVPDYLCIYLLHNGLERSRHEDGQLLRVKDAQLLGLPRGSVEGL